MGIQIQIIEQVSPKNAATIDRPDLNLTGNALSKQQTYEAIAKEKLMGIRGEAKPTSSPTNWQTGQPDLYEKWDVKTLGIYTNFKKADNSPIEVTATDLKENYVQIWVQNGVCDKYLSLKPQVPGIVEIPFNASIKFENEKAISKVTLPSNTNFTYNGVNAKLNSIHICEIIPNGFTFTIDSSFTTEIQSDIDYTKPISILFQKPLTPNLKPWAIVVNMSEIDNTIPAPRYKVNPVGGTLINTWFEWFEFPSHIVVNDDCIYNVGFFNYSNNNYVGANFTKVGTGATGRWANFAILATEWQANTVYEINEPGISGVRFKTGSVKPAELIQANTANFTLIAI